MKSLNFTVPGLWDKIISGEKRCTIRGLYIPTYAVGEDILLRDVERHDGRKTINAEVVARVTNLSPIHVQDIDDTIARAEGFSDAAESRAWISATYNCKNNPGRWVFITWWDNVRSAPATPAKKSKIKIPPAATPALETYVKQS